MIIGLLNNLRVFEAINCGLNNQKISDELFKLDLVELDLSENQIESIEMFTKLQKCKQLRVRNNRIRSLPSSVYHYQYEQLPEMKELESLDIRYNYLTELVGLKDNQNLKRVLVKGNNIESKEEEAIRQGIDSLREYYKQLY